MKKQEPKLDITVERRRKKAKRAEAGEDRIKRAIDEGFPFEALVIEESHLSNSLAIFLHTTTERLTRDEVYGGKVKANGKLTYSKTFAQLIKDVETEAKSDLWDTDSELWDRVTEWRKERNRFVHRFIKFDHLKGAVDEPSKFVAEAIESAHKGWFLCQEVYKWREAQSKRKRVHTRQKNKLKATRAAK